MAAMHIRRHMRQLTLLPLVLIALGCVTDPDGVASVSASPSNLSFASIHAPAQTLTVTVTGTNGKTRTDVPVTWTHWETYGDPIASSRVIIVERDGTADDTLSGSAATFNDRVIQGTGVFTLRFSSPGLTPVVSNPIAVSSAIVTAQ